MTPKEIRNIEIALTGFVGPVDALLWAYLDLSIDRVLTESEREEIRVRYLGYWPQQQTGRTR